MEHFAALIEGDAFALHLAFGLECGAEVVEDVGRFGEAVVEDDAVKFVVVFVDDEALLGLDVRDFLEADGEEHDLFVEGFVVLQMVKEGEREAVGIGAHEDGGAGHADDAVFFDLIDEELDREAAAHHGLIQDAASVHPGLHDDPHAAADGEGEPAALRDFQHAAAEVAEFEHEEDEHGQQGFPQIPLPHVTGHEEEKQTRHGHVHGNGEAVGGGEVRRGLEGEDEA